MQSADLGDLTRELLRSLAPTEAEAEDASAGIGMLGWKRTGAAMLVYGIWQKACRGDVSAAKLLRELSLDRSASEERDGPDPRLLASLSDEELLRLLGDPEEKENGS